MFLIISDIIQTDIIIHVLFTRNIIMKICIRKEIFKRDYLQVQYRFYLFFSSQFKRREMQPNK